MISPETLRRYRFFGFADDTQLKALALVTEEVCFEPATIIFEAGRPADRLHLLLDGSVDLLHIIESEGVPAHHRELLVGQINPGEPFGISAVIEPYVMTSTAVATVPSRVLRLDAAALRALAEVDCRLGYGLMRRIAAAASERLHFTRIQLAAARA
jgi:CRP-like cAMP-binding protein